MTVVVDIRIQYPKVLVRISGGDVRRETVISAVGGF